MYEYFIVIHNYYFLTGLSSLSPGGGADNRGFNPLRLSTKLSIPKYHQQEEAT